MSAILEFIFMLLVVVLILLVILPGIGNMVGFDGLPNVSDFIHMFVEGGV